MDNILPALYSIISFIAIWIGVFFLISLFGWRKLHDEFALPERSLGNFSESFSWKSIRINTFCNYNNCINIFISSSGVMLKLPILFSAFHKPVFIPWRKMKNLTFNDGLIKKTKVEVNGTKIIFYSRVAESINFNLKEHN